MIWGLGQARGEGLEGCSRPGSSATYINQSVFVGGGDLQSYPFSQPDPSSLLGDGLGSGLVVQPSVLPTRAVGSP